MTNKDLAAWVRSKLVKRRDCRVWTGARNSDGYGVVRNRGRMMLTHRLICTAAHGPAPRGKPIALHSCGNRACARSSHLRWGSLSQNQKDRYARRRR